MDHTEALYDDIYSAAVVMARVGHLDRAKREDVERATRMIREGLDGAGALDPKPMITTIMLTGTHARRTWSAEEGASTLPVFDFWIIVNDRLFTHRRLWQATEARIRDAIGHRCTVRLSFSAAQSVRAGRRSGNVCIVDRLNAGITLFRAKRDAPASRRGKGRTIWSEALGRFDSADAAFRPASERYRDAERTRFAGANGTSAADDEFARDQAHALNAALAEQQRLGDALHEATMALLHTPAPDLAAIIRKLELVRDIGDGDDHATISILADVRWIAARLAATGEPS